MKLICKSITHNALVEVEKAVEHMGRVYVGEVFTY
jgi:hypothetical protein